LWLFKHSRYFRESQKYYYNLRGSQKYSYYFGDLQEYSYMLEGSPKIFLLFRNPKKIAIILGDPLVKQEENVFRNLKIMEIMEHPRQK